MSAGSIAVGESRNLENESDSVNQAGRKIMVKMGTNLRWRRRVWY